MKCPNCSQKLPRWIPDNRVTCINCKAEFCRDNCNWTNGLIAASILMIHQYLLMPELGLIWGSAVYFVLAILISAVTTNERKFRPCTKEDDLKEEKRKKNEEGELFR